jgi:putative FmdB family regulatory protein
MPTYEYECTKCGHTFEALQRMKDAPLSSCPQCRGRVRRLIGGGMGVIFKGSGFYTTDYRKGPSLTGGNGNGKDKAKEAGAGKTGETTPAKAADSATGSAKAEKAPVT